MSIELFLPPKFVPADEREAYREALRKMGVNPDTLDARYANVYADPRTGESKTWEEALHPRDASGRFSSDGGGGDEGAWTTASEARQLASEWAGAPVRISETTADYATIVTEGDGYLLGWVRKDGTVVEAERGMTAPPPASKPITLGDQQHARIPAMIEHGAIVTNGKIIAPRPEFLRDIEQNRMLSSAEKRQIVERELALLENTHVYIAVSPNILNQVLDDGRFKSQFESHDSCGEYNPLLRAEIESNFFGQRQTEAEADVHPIYGYISKTEDGTKGGYVDSYGDVYVRLKDDVRARTTFMYGDSLGPGIERRGAPSPMLAPSWTSIGRDDPIDEIGWRDHGPANESYVEAQIHEGVHLEDIESVTFSDPSLHLVQAVKARLDALGIPYKDVVA